MILSYCLSILALIVAIATYLHSVYRFHKYDSKLSSLQIENEQREANAANSAAIVGEIVNEPKKLPCLVLSNTGQHSADNLYVSADENIKFAQHELIPFSSLGPGQSLKLYFLMLKHTNPIDFILSYSDGDGEKRIHLYVQS